MSLRLTLIQKGDLCYSRLLSNNRVLCACAPSGHSTREQLIKGRFFEGLWIINEGNENKLYLQTLILLLIEWTGMVEIKHKDFIDIVPKVLGLH